MSKKNKIIIISAAAALIIAIIVGLIFLLPGDNGGTTSSTPSSDIQSTEVTSKPSKNVEETVEKIEIDKDDTSVTVDDIETARGNTFSIPITLNNNPGISSSAIEFLYNTDKLVYLGYEEGNVFENYYFKQTEDSIQFINIEEGDIKKNGLLFKLKFRVKDDAVLGDTEVKINVNDECFVNMEEKFVTGVKGGNSVITIK